MSPCQQTLHTERITLVPLAPEREVELDSDYEVLRYLTGRASTREEVVANQRAADGGRAEGGRTRLWLASSTTSSSAGGSFSPPTAPTSPTTRAWPTWATGCCSVSAGA